MTNDLIVVRQLPVIEDQLRTIHDAVQARVEDVLAMECTEETYKEVKKARSELNAQYRALEERRKEVKTQVEAPYKKFEAVYKACAGDLFAAADKQLAAKISAVETGLKQKKAEQVKAYFDEYRESLGIPFDMVNFGITVTMSASLKSLKAQAKDYLDRVRGDLDMISTQEHNHIAIMGRLTRDPELRRTGSGTAVTSFTLAVDRDFSGKDGGEKETDFIDCVAWRQTAEFVSKYFSKGRMALVSGRLQIRGWTDKDGNKRRAAEVIADSVYFGDSKKEMTDHEPDTYYPPQPPASDYAMLDYDDERLPF